MTAALLLAPAVPHVLDVAHDWADTLLPVLALAALLWRPLHSAVRRFQTLIEATEANTAAIADLTQRLDAGTPPVGKS